VRERWGENGSLKTFSKNWKELMLSSRGKSSFSFDCKGRFPYHHHNIVRGKTVLLQAWSGPEGSRKLRFADFMTTAQNGGKVVNLTHWQPLPPGNTPGTHFC